jgi:hypothetical protein
MSMTRVFRIVARVLVLFLASSVLIAQFRPEEIARRDADEEFLKTAEIVRFEEIGQGVTRPFKLFLKNGDRESAAVWKNPSGVQYGFLEGWQYEIAAYRLDELIGLNMIPPSVERTFRGRKGALILWAENENSLEDLFEKRIRIPDAAQDHTEKMKWLTRAWDCLIANEDRTQQNILYTEDWRVILIDHSRAFRSTKKFTERLMFGKRGLKMSSQGAPFLFRRLPRQFVEKISGLTFESVKAAVGGSLTNREVRAILTRRDLLLEEIDEMVREQGEGAVLY